MTAKRPNTFAPSQEAKQARRERLIDEYLAYLSKTRVRVRYVTDLAELVATYIKHAEGKPCVASTLMRNIRYKGKLMTYQAQRDGAGVESSSARAVTDPTAKALVTTAQLATANLKRELERLNIYVESLEQQLDESTRRHGKFPSSSDSGGGAEPFLTDYEYRFIRTCQALRLLLSHLNVIVGVDPNTQRILDSTKRRDNVIVEKDVAGPFFEWLASNGAKSFAETA
jgi:hypothetical protein